MGKVFLKSILTLAGLFLLFRFTFWLSGNQPVILKQQTAEWTNADCQVLDTLSLSALICILLGIVTCLVTYYGTEGRLRISLWNNLEKHLTWLFVFTWTLGFCVYLTGMYIGNEGADFLFQCSRLLCQVPMACYYAFGMFVFQSDVSAIHSEFFTNLMFMSLFSLAHFMAAVVSLAFVLKYFGYAISSKIRLFFAEHNGGAMDELYVFWGMNNASYHLATDINRQYKTGRIKGAYKIIVVNTAEYEGGEMQATAISRLFSFMSFSRERLRQFKELKCLTTSIFHRLSKVEINEAVEHQDILLEAMEATSLVRLIRNTRSRVHIFLLGNDEENNILCTGNLCRDTCIHDFLKAEGKEVCIYCHARYDSINRVVEDRYSDQKLYVKVVDSSHESINLLRSRESCHPVHFVDIDTQDNYGTITSPFCALVIGLGETGRDAVRYLYEYGTFVHAASSKEDDAPEMEESERSRLKVERSSFRCYVADREADRLEGLFKANAPAMKGIEIWHDDIFTSAFYEKLEPICKDLNYVVIALGDDELNITVAVRLFNYVRKHKKDMRHFAIFVRCHSDKHRKQLQNVADHYNQKRCTGIQQEYITIFGTDVELNTYGQIVENNFVKEGKEFFEMYRKAAGGKSWEERRRILLGKRTLEALSELRRKESQDIANAYHAMTKMSIIKKVVYDDNGNVREGFNTLSKYVDGTLPELKIIERQHFDKDGRGSFCHGILKAMDNLSEKETLLLRNMARLEHLRWMAAHEVLGYQSYAEGDKDCILVEDRNGNRHCCNETFKLHNCLTDWNLLDQEANNVQNEWHPDYKRFDFIVVTTTLMLQNKANNLINN